MNLKVLESGPAWQMKWCPDVSKRLIAYSESSDGPDGISVIGFDGSGYRQLVKQEGISPEWSPDGTHLAYWRFYYPNSGLCVMSLDGKTARGHECNSVGTTLWSPQIRYLAAVVDYRDEKKTLVVVDTLTSDLKPLISIKDVSSLVGWSRGGNILYFYHPDDQKMYQCDMRDMRVSKAENLYSSGVSSEGYFAYSDYETAIHVVAPNKVEHIISAYDGEQLIWSADGSRLMFTAHTLGGKLLVGKLATLYALTHRREAYGEGLFIADRDSSTAQLVFLKDKHGYIGWQAISPDGKYICFTRDGEHKIHVATI